MEKHTENSSVEHYMESDPNWVWMAYDERLEQLTKPEVGSIVGSSQLEDGHGVVTEVREHFLVVRELLTGKETALDYSHLYVPRPGSIFDGVKVELYSRKR